MSMPEEIPVGQSDRDRGVLSKADREFLLGEKDLTDQSTVNTRYRIRNRVRNGVYDFVLLELSLGNDDKRQIFEGIDPITLSKIPAFLLNGLIEVNGSIEDGRVKFEQHLEEGIRSVYKERKSDHVVNEVSVNVKTTKTDMEDLHQRFWENELSVHELTHVMGRDDFEPEQSLVIGRLLQQWSETSEEEEEEEELSSELDLSQIGFDSVEELEEAISEAEEEYRSKR